jgi:hypothetical protein
MITPTSNTLATLPMISRPTHVPPSSILLMQLRFAFAGKLKALRKNRALLDPTDIDGYAGADLEQLATLVPQHSSATGATI